MSVQSESGRVDYSKSDHAPKGQRMAGEVVPFEPAHTIGAAIGRMKNLKSEQDAIAGTRAPDTTNIELFPKDKMKQ